VYHQSVVIRKSISLVGDAAILDGNTPADDGTVLTPDAITIAGGVSGVTVKGFEIRYYSGYGILVSKGGTSNINIAANVIHDIGIVAVEAVATGTGLQENWFIDGNTIRNFASGIEVAGGKRVVISKNLVDQGLSCGICVTVEADNAVDSEGVTVTGNKVTHASSLMGKGIYVASFSATAHLRHIVIMRNTVSSCGNGGIFIGQEISPTYPPIEDVVVSFNTVDNNAGTGIDLQGPVAGGQVSANTITNNGLDGIHSLINSKITISGNLIHHNYRDGISIVSSNDNQVIGNTVTESRYGIYLATGDGFTPPSRNVIMFNTAKGNLVYDVYWDGTGTGNVWKLNSYNTKNW